MRIGQSSGEETEGKAVLGAWTPCGVARTVFSVINGFPHCLVGISVIKYCDQNQLGEERLNFCSGLLDHISALKEVRART